MSTLDIDTVRAFLLVADLQSFTRTAEALGATQAAKFEAVHGDLSRLPGLHSSEFAPDPQPTLTMGAAALAVAAMELLGKR